MARGEALDAGELDQSEVLLGVDAARERILAAVAPLEPVRVPLLDALGLVLSRDIVAAEAIPPFCNSAMDGYAVCAADTTGASARRPVTLAVVGQAPAGAVAGPSIGPGESVRIMTGAPLPAGADAVVRFEETDELEHPGVRDRVQVRRAVSLGANVRAAGEDVAVGATVLRAGTSLGPAELGLLAALNWSEAPVHRRPIVAILSTGDEVVPVGAPLAPGQIRDSNSITIGALVKRLGAKPLLLGAARDDITDIRERLARAEGADLLLTSGGVSVGDFDLVKQVLRQEGQVDLWQVRIKPGKPMAFGHIGHAPLLGLPGNPVAALVAFLQFARPALMRMLGHRSWSPPLLPARLACLIENRGRRRHFVRGIAERRGGEILVRPISAQGSASLTSVTQANCLIVIPEEWEQAPAGATVAIELLDGGVLG